MRWPVLLLALFLITPFASAERAPASIDKTVPKGDSPWELSLEITSEDDGAEHDIVWENKTGFTVNNDQEAWALDAGDTLVWRFTITELQEGTEGTFAFDYTLTVDDVATETGTLTLTIKEGGGIADKVPDGLPIPAVAPVALVAALAAVAALLRRR